MNLFRNINLEVDRASDTELLLVVRNYRMANKLNRTLNRYYPTTIIEGEEPLFRITNRKFEEIRLPLGLPSGLGLKIDSSLKNDSENKRIHSDEGNIDAR